MSRKKKSGFYEVGYARPPVATRFSATSQPKRVPRYAKPKGKTISEIGEEKRVLTDKTGHQRTTTINEIIRESLRAKALEGNIAAMREIYRQYDAEQDAAALRGRPVSKKLMREARAPIKMVLRQLLKIGERLCEQGLAEIVAGHLIVPQSVRDACHRRVEDRNR